MLLKHNNHSRLSNWWWTIDKTLFICIIILMLIGVFLTFSASPAVANRIGVGSYHFIKRHLFFTPIALAAMIFVSMQSLKYIRRGALIGYITFMFLVLLTFFCGEATKGASRWLNICGFSLQPSEFIKPLFIITTAWLFDGHYQHKEFPGHIICLGLILITAGMIFKQPDFGMTVVISTIWLFQLALTGIPVIYIALLVGMGVFAGIGAYFVDPHIQVRVHQFLESDGELSYQVKKSIEAFQSGNLFGRGPGEGIVRSHIPDAHTDFIYAVAAEEYGIFLCLIIVALYATVVIRSLMLSCNEKNMFIMLSASGLAASFGLQSMINMASTLHLMPTKGMTLPFISYGGSSTIATAIGMGMLLALTRKNIHAEDKDGV